MLRLFTILPPICSYIIALVALAVTYSLSRSLIEAGFTDNLGRIWLVGGIVAFSFGFGGFQRSLELRELARRSRISSSDVMQKLVPKETGLADKDLDVPPAQVAGPDANSPLGRLRARSGQGQV